MARILVVDDSSIMRRNLSTILSSAGHLVVGEAFNGELAFHEYVRLKPDLVTMDITMPVMDGIGAVKKIIDSYPDAKIIMISALDQKYMVLNAIQCGAKHYIIKPFTSEKVTAVIDEVVRASGNVSLEGSGVSNQLDGAIKNINNAIRSVHSSIDLLDNANTSTDQNCEMPFTVENKGSFLLISLSNHIKDENLNALKMVVQGFLFIKPLKIIIDFADMHTLTDGLAKKVKELITMVQNVAGDIKLASRNEYFIDSLSSTALTTGATLYSDKSELDF